jgi:hypothetical protein
MLFVGLTNLLFILRYAVSRPNALRGPVYYFILFSLFMFSAFRYRVGCDWIGYYLQYTSAADLDWSAITSIQEPIWWLICRWINANGLPYPVLNVVSSAVFFLGINSLARRQPDSLGFLVLLFPILIVNMPMSGIRQGAAIGLICIAIVSCIDRRPLRFSIWVFLAAGFHTSALVFIVLLPLAVRGLNRYSNIVAGFFVLPAGFVIYSVGATDLATSRYVGTGIDAAGAAFRVGILTVTALYFFFHLRRRWLRAWPEDYALVNLGAISMLLMPLLLPISTVIADRFGYYLIPIQTMIFARLPYLQLRRNAALHTASPYLVLLSIFAVWANFSWHFKECYIPYQTWLFGFPGGDPVGF